MREDAIADRISESRCLGVWIASRVCVKAIRMHVKYYRSLYSGGGWESEWLSAGVVGCH